MKIKYSDASKKLMQVCGVPSGLLIPTDIDAKKLLQNMQEEYEEKIICNIRLPEQQKTLKKLEKLYELDPCIIAMHASVDYLKLRRFAAPWFCNYAKWTKANALTSKGILPYWHYVTATFNDELLQIAFNRNPIISFTEFKPLIVLDGIYTDSCSQKLDNVRDLVNNLTDHIIILLLSGNNPYTFCHKRLALDVDHWVSFGVERTRTVL